MESRIKDENYYQVHGWMLNRLGLKGVKLQVYAIIYGFTQDGVNHFTGSLQYLCDFTGTTKPTVIKSLSELTESGLILKTESEINGVKACSYRANLDAVSGSKETLLGGKETLLGSKEILLGGSKEILLGSKETLPGGSKKTLPNNKYIDNKADNKNYINNVSKADKGCCAKKDAFEEFADNNTQLLETLRDFEIMRKSIKKPLTERGKQILLTKLKELSENPEQQIKIIEQSIEHSWQSVYQLKMYTSNVQKANTDYSSQSDPFQQILNKVKNS